MFLFVWGVFFGGGGTEGNEQVDRLAREGGQLEQEDRYTTYTDEKTSIKTFSKNKMEAATPKLQPVRQNPQNEQDRAGYHVEVEQVQGWRV